MSAENVRGKYLAKQQSSITPDENVMLPMEFL
jgi:hypothetical protein